MNTKKSFKTEENISKLQNLIMSYSEEQVNKMKREIEEIKWRDKLKLMKRKSK